MIPSILEERGGVIWFPCAAWECGVDASHPALLGGIASLTHALRVKNGLRRMGTHSSLRRRQLLTCDAQESNWMRRILNCIPMRRMGTRWKSRKGCHFERQREIFPPDYRVLSRFLPMVEMTTG